MARDRLVRVVRLVLVALVVAFVVAAVASNWSKVRPHLRELSAGWMTLAAISVMAGIYASMLSWRAVLADLGSPLPQRAAVRVYFLGQLGKYLPGSVWPVVAQMELGRQHDVPRARSAAAGLVSMLMGLMAAALVAAACVPFLDNVPGYAWLALLLLPVGAVVLHPPYFSALVARVLRVLRREPLEHSLSRRGELRALGWAVVSWLALGVHAWAIARDLGPLKSGLLPVAVGGFALAWMVGFLVVFMPAGIGPREAVLVAIFAGYLPGGRLGGALALAVVSRLLISLADVSWAVLAVVMQRSRRPAV